MKVDVVNVIELLERKKVYIIPVFQRNYSWSILQCDKLFNDIVDIIEYNHQNPSEQITHFFGTICFNNNDDYRQLVIDGQQRLTSSYFLLLKILKMT